MQGLQPRIVRACAASIAAVAAAVVFGGPLAAPGVADICVPAFGSEICWDRDVLEPTMNMTHCIPPTPTIDDTNYCTSIRSEKDKPTSPGLNGAGDPMGAVEGAQQTTSPGCAGTGGIGVGRGAAVDSAVVGPNDGQLACAADRRFNHKNAYYCYNHYTGGEAHCADRHDGYLRHSYWHYVQSKYVGSHGRIGVCAVIKYENDVYRRMACGTNAAESGYFRNSDWVNANTWNDDNNRHSIDGYAER
jgi:hypothetical protein